MKYEELALETREALEAGKFAAIRYSSLRGESGKVDDAILFGLDSDVDVEKMDGYVKGPVGVWFAFVASGKSDEEAAMMAEEAASDIVEVSDEVL